jgi:hypothetical protein
MVEFGPRDQIGAALQSILETTHSLQMRVFRATLRRSLNELSVNELELAKQGIETAIADLRQHVRDA